MRHVEWRRGGDSNPRSHKGSRDFESRRLNLTPEPLRASESIPGCYRTVKHKSAEALGLFRIGCGLSSATLVRPIGSCQVERLGSARAGLMQPGTNEQRPQLGTSRSLIVPPVPPPS